MLAKAIMLFNIFSVNLKYTNWNLLNEKLLNYSIYYSITLYTLVKENGVNQETKVMGIYSCQQMQSNKIF